MAIHEPVLYAVVGKPIAHSRSPAMHNSAFRALGIPAKYVRIAAGSPEQALRKARTLGVKGLNITSPFKEDFARLCYRLDRPAKRLGVVNTVVFKDGKLLGFNTDVYGVAQALRSNGIPLKGRKAVVVGAGGAAKAAVYALLSEGMKVTMANRTAGKARVIAESMGCGHSSLQSAELGDVLIGSGLIVSAVSTTDRIVNPGLLNETLSVLDANYSEESALTKDARLKGCTIIDGREWLLFQGVKAFEIFTRREAPLEVMRRAIYSETPKGK